MPAIIKLQNFQVNIDNNCLLSIHHLEIFCGEKIVVVGPSGAGKSSLLNVLYEQLNEAVSWCPQNLGLVPNLTVFHNIYMGRLSEHHWLYNLWNLFWPITKICTEIKTLISGLELKQQLFQAVETLSGGQKQRTALARAWYADKEIFIGDEPTSSIDQNHATLLIDQTIQRFNTVIIASHDLDIALKQFERIIVINAGQIILDKKTKNTSHSEIKSLLSRSL